MALQHFYSRIPARASMFNKSDSYDTFACSDGLTREFIERELSIIDDYKPTAEETTLIRRTQLPPLYAQMAVKSGELVQSAISFLASDYTGERTSYMVHSLVFSEKEKKRVLASLNGSVFNAANFVTDISGFNLTSPETRPVYDYPELSYVKAPAGKTDWLSSDYDANVMKRFIFAVLNAICGKGKQVYAVLGDSISQFSEKALEFVNAFMQILPYHLRELLSFVTYTGDFSRYNTFKLKFLPADASVPPVSKGVTVNFVTGIVMGVKNEDYTAMAPVVEFLYSLLTQEEVRREFLLFADHAAGDSPSLASASLKTIADLVFLFRCCSTMFDENKVLSDSDKVYDFMCVYEKYRTALSDENRMAGMRCLKRYPKAHAAIPKNVFAKLSRIYPQESAGVKRVIMNVVLELIHTDVMRDKLFAFIKNNYEAEDDEMKAIINGDLCRVFYGGFLQPQILTFFARNFPAEPVSTRDAILDKVLLAIRTKAIQSQIMEFLRAYYGTFTKSQKKHLYATIFDMLPEGDELAMQLISLVDAYISDESESFKSEFADKFLALIETEQRRREHPLLKCVVKTTGYCAAVLIKQIFIEWSGRKIFAEYVDDIAQLDTDGKTDALAAAIKAVPYMPREQMDKFIEELAEAYKRHPDKGNFFRAVESEQKLSDKLSSIHGDTVTVFAEKYADCVISPYLCAQMPEFFRLRRPDGVTIMRNYAARHPAIEELPGYELFANFSALLECAERGDAAGVIDRCEQLPAAKTTGQNAAQYMDAQLIKSDVLSGAAKVDIKALVIAAEGRLTTGEYDFEKAYRQLESDKLAAENPSGAKMKDAKIFAVRSEVFNAVLFMASSAYKAVDQKAKEQMTGGNSSLSAVVAAFAGRDNKYAKAAAVAVQQIPGAEKVFSDSLKGMAEAVKPQKQGFFAKLFKR